ncbi:unnamed protein product [Mesocestoides corti]|uniref:Uncharacterized protein n=1 Tax=Mesocestoides corti TaxID=53468 RepID=A0A0R3UNR3_MESCO|nr:unnamed protein product [Mesocestoides corti]
MQKVVDLLESVVLLPNDGESERLSGYPLATEIIECVCQFPLEGPTLMRLKTACKRLLSQSVDSSSSQQQMANLIRCLFTNKLSKLFNCEDLMEFVPLLRQRIRLSELVTSDDISLLFDTLSLIFRSNCPLKLQWISYLYREYSKSDSGYDSLFDDLLILLLANGTELSVESNPDATVSIKRKEVSLVLKTLGPVAERIASFDFCEPGGEQSSMVVMQLCNTICPSMPKTSGRPQVAKKTAIILDIVLQLSKAFSEKLSPFSDILLTLVDRISTSEGGEGRQPDIPDLRDIRKLYAILVYTAFWLRTVGLIGAVTVLEMLCRKQKRPENEGLINNTPMSQIENVECSQSGVLASQIIPVNSQVPGSPNSSRNSYGHLSLKGPGTSLADDSQEINLPIESELDSENQESGRAFLPQPSRLILQLVGLVENAIRQTQLTQLKVLWLDELAAMFARLEETMRQGDASLATNAKTFIDWMGSRVMREFQEEFVVDNAATPGNETHLALNRREICEIALNVGPAFTRHMASTASTRPLLLTQVGNQTSHKRPRLSAPRNLCPSLIPCHLHLLAVVESTRSNRSLDGNFILEIFFG